MLILYHINTILKIYILLKTNNRTTKCVHNNFNFSMKSIQSVPSVR